MAFATPEDVATRLGRDLSAIEAGTVETLLDVATSIITDFLGKTSDWATDLDPIHPVLRWVTMELAARTMVNPDGSSMFSETLGAYSYTKGFRAGSSDSTPGIMLTKHEELIVTQAVYGTLTGSSTPRTWADRALDLQESRDIDEIEA